jgi:hypothetical protein
MTIITKNRIMFKCQKKKSLHFKKEWIKLSTYVKQMLKILQFWHFKVKADIVNDIWSNRNFYESESPKESGLLNEVKIF